MITYENNIIEIDKLEKELSCDCGKCFGLCCVALFFSATDGFPTDKEAGKPCINLSNEFKCKVHGELSGKGLKGCTAFECIGAGQKVSQITFGGMDWKKDSKNAQKMFDTFIVMRQLHEMLWYLNQALQLQENEENKNKICRLITETERITLADSEQLLNTDVEEHRDKVNILLKNTAEQAYKTVFNAPGKQENGVSNKDREKNHRSDYFGADLRRTDLRGAKLMGACMIAANIRNVDLSGANMIGADLRGADLRGACLEKSLYLTQAQINTAKGDVNTKLPAMIKRPSHWQN